MTAPFGYLAVLPAGITEVACSGQFAALAAPCAHRGPGGPTGQCSILQDGAVC
jgi:hypothetical protein